MFGNRQNSQKPDDGLINKFQATFSDISRPTKCDPSGLATNDDLNYLSTLDSSGLRFTPFFDHSIPASDPHNSRQYHNTGSFNTAFHGPTGDLHTPQPEPNLMTPKTLLGQFAVAPLHTNYVDPFKDNPNMQQSAHEPQAIAPGNLNVACPPTTFVHSHLADGGANRSGEAVSLADDASPQNLSPHQLLISQDSHSPEREYRSQGDCQFRYQVTLNTPTAMMEDAKHPPTTYLNKARTYSLSIVDTAQPVTNEVAVHRTWIRVTFEDDEQASNPAAAWALWRNIRGHEAYRKEGNLYAIEFVDLSQENDGQTCDHIQLERISLDGFCVTWLSDPTTGHQGCSMGVRFHFLSTDFSHAKGVKGAPIKLCAKTEAVTLNRAEISYCKVKLFREHGAERKMFNEVSQLKRAIVRCRQDFVKAENGGEDIGKRKRGRRTVSYYSNKKIEGERKNELQRDLDKELAMIQNRFHSNRPVTKFSLRGRAKDDPDLFPIIMEDDEGQRIDRMDEPNLQPLTPSSTLGSLSRNLSYSYTDHGSARPRQDRTPSTSSLSPQASLASIDSKRNAPVACFYLRFQTQGAQQDNYYTAVYLTERTAKELKTKISHKKRFNQDHKLQLFQVKKGIKIMIDDDVVLRIPNGQDMIAEISEIPSNMAASGSTIEVKLDV
ncbi:hypothetical protein PENANT_c201G06336 [Penicillium antarcticum]|uniref:Grh/CP2 DB domain-containing protein n=1 Tax=Penicillium antarcticum TaxID=416450 RepID=A0A1V6P947_9EURO|nr:uncharacterized protein N7508_007418 [Penicillium antarcticum]KAJ5300175.1 hypothetical protein N7508_007418 [Penicillium antarcticum]OQD73539.1 hypothetical protein PENANT_c201G06336 [Penicillium antarcticum]